MLKLVYNDDDNDNDDNDDDVAIKDGENCVVLIMMMMVDLHHHIIKNHNEERIEQCLTWFLMMMILTMNRICKDDQLIAVQCVSPGLGCTRLALEGSKPPHHGFYRQPSGLGERHQLEAALGQPLLVKVSSHRRGDPPGWQCGEMWLLFCLLS